MKKTLNYRDMPTTAVLVMFKWIHFDGSNRFIQDHYIYLLLLIIVIRSIWRRTLDFARLFQHKKNDNGM